MAGFFNPENAAVDKGFLDGRHLKVTDAAFVIHDGEGNWERESACLYLELTDMEGKLERPVDQYYSIGAPDNYTPVQKGKALKIAPGKAMSKRSNIYHFAVSLVNAGVPAELVDAMEDDVTVLIGMEFRMGTTMRHKKDKRGLETVDEVFVMPGETADPEAKAKEVVAAIISDNGGSVAIKGTLPKKLTEALKDFDADEAKAIRKAALNQKFLSDNFEVEGNTVAI